MCVIGAKYLKNLGWVGFKNRDRNYFANVEIKSEFTGLEKLIIWDSITRYSEGINEKGISILSACLSVKDDEDEITLARNKLIEIGEYQSPIGRTIRAALSLPSIDLVVQYLIDNETTGHSLIFNANTLYSLEGAYKFDLNGIKTESYEHFITKIESAKGYIVRTNHGIMLPYAGYQYNELHWANRVSSEERLNQVKTKLKNANSKNEIIEVFSTTSNEHTQLNPLRIDFLEKQMKTTGQIMLVPKLRELWYRPVLGKMIVDSDTIKTNKNVFKILKEISDERIKAANSSYNIHSPKRGYGI